MSEPVPTQPECDSNAGATLQLIQNSLDEMFRKSVPITRETRIDQYFIEAFGVDTFDCPEMSLELELYWDIELSEEDWKFLSGYELCPSPEEWEAQYAHMFTFGRLADLIAGRMKLGSLEPVTILGATSLATGAFRRLQVLAARIDANVEDFAPSTKILNRFGGSKLREFWALLRAVSGNRVPPLEETTASWLANSFQGTPGVVLSLVVGAAVTLGFHRLALGGRLGASVMESLLILAALLLASLMMSCVPAILLLVVTGVLRLFTHQTGPRGAKLPRGIETFRDVSLLIAGDRGGWCRQCGYDLTGLNGRRCPECGKPQKAIKIPTANQAAGSALPHEK